MKMNMLLLLIAFVPVLYRLTNAFPAGAPDSTCISMQPRVQAHGNAQTTAPPYVIQVDKSYYYENNTVKVYIKACGDATIKGFLIEAREKGQQIPLGSFTDVPPQTQHLDCTAMNAETAWSAVTHSSRLSSKMLSFTWEPSNMTTGDIYFMATIVQSQPTYWLGVKSVELMKMGSNMKNSNPVNMECPGSGGNGTTPGMKTTKSKGNVVISSVAANIALLVLVFSAKLFI